MASHNVSSVIVDSTLSPDAIEAVLRKSSLNTKSITRSGDAVTSDHGSQLMYRLWGAYTALGRKNIPARISITPVDGAPGRREITVDPDSRYYVVTVPKHDEAARELARKVADLVTAGS